MRNKDAWDMAHYLYEYDRYHLWSCHYSGEGVCKDGDACELWKARLMELKMKKEMHQLEGKGLERMSDGKRAKHQEYRLKLLRET